MIWYLFFKMDFTNWLKSLDIKSKQISDLLTLVLPVSYHFIRILQRFWGLNLSSHTSGEQFTLSHLPCSLSDYTTGLLDKMEPPDTVSESRNLWLDTSEALGKTNITILRNGYNIKVKQNFLLLCCISVCLSIFIREFSL